MTCSAGHGGYDYGGGGYDQGYDGYGYDNYGGYGNEGIFSDQCSWRWNLKLWSQEQSRKDDMVISSFLFLLSPFFIWLFFTTGAQKHMKQQSQLAQVTIAKT